MRSERRVLPRTWVPSAVTAANIAAGFLAMLLATDGRYRQAVYMLILAVVLDVLDGRLARWLRATSEFGRQMDSFADTISSGVAPALLIYLAVLRPLGVLATLAVLTYLLAGVFRLARFNLTTDAHSKDDQTLGVPIPIGAGYLMALTLMGDRIDPAISLMVVLLAAVGMVSRWRLPMLKGSNLVTAMLGVGICNYLTMAVWTNWITFAWWNVWNVLILLAARSGARRLALDQSTNT